MPERRMLIIDADVVKKVDENRGDMSCSEFIQFLIEGQLEQSGNGHSNNHITKDEFRQFEQGIKELLRNFFEFFLSYGLEMGKEPTAKELDKLSQKLQAIDGSITVKAKSS